MRCVLLHRLRADAYAVLRCVRWWILPVCVSAFYVLLFCAELLSRRFGVGFLGDASENLINCVLPAVPCISFFACCGFSEIFKTIAELRAAYGFRENSAYTESFLFCTCAACASYLSAVAVCAAFGFIFGFGLNAVGWVGCAARGLAFAATYCSVFSGAFCFRSVGAASLTCVGFVLFERCVLLTADVSEQIFQSVGFGAPFVTVAALALRLAFPLGSLQFLVSGGTLYPVYALFAVAAAVAVRLLWKLSENKIFKGKNLC